MRLVPTGYGYVRTDNASFMFYRQRIARLLSPRTDSASLGSVAACALALDTPDVFNPPLPV